MYNRERMIEHLPSHFQAQNNESVIFKLLTVIGNSLDVAEQAIGLILYSKWVSTADRSELERLGKLFGVNPVHSDKLDQYRSRIVKTVNDIIKGRSTPTSIKSYIHSSTGLEPEIIENPIVNAGSQPLFLRSGDRWDLFCNSIVEAEPFIKIRGVTSIRNPMITNLSTGESVSYNGLLRKGAVLRILPDGQASLVGIDVSDRIVVNSKSSVRLPKGLSEWRYSDSNAFFNTAKFNVNALADDRPDMVEVKMDWTERQPAVVAVKVPMDKGNEQIKMEIADLLERVRPVGVKFLIEFSEMY
jgi:hypothetical protein